MRFRENSDESLFYMSQYLKETGRSQHQTLTGPLLATPLTTFACSRVGDTQLNNTGRHLAHCKRHVYANISHDTIYSENMCDLPI